MEGSKGHLSIGDVKPNYKLSFNNDSATIGTLDFNGPELVFIGDAEESAKIFIEFIAKFFSGRLVAERERCAELVDHIPKESGGTFGDAIRQLV